MFSVRAVALILAAVQLAAIIDAKPNSKIAPKPLVPAAKVGEKVSVSPTMANKELPAQKVAKLVAAKPAVEKPYKEVVKQAKATTLEAGKPAAATPKGNSNRLLAGKTVPAKPEAAEVRTTAHAAVGKVASTNATKKLAPASQNITEEDEMKRLHNGLSSMQKLRGLFTGSLVNGEVMNRTKGTGYLIDQLGRKDSKVWGAIEGMLTVTGKVLGDLKGKSQPEKNKLLKGLKDDMATKIAILREVAARANSERVQRKSAANTTIGGAKTAKAANVFLQLVDRI